MASSEQTRRLAIQAKLEAVLGSQNVYFNAPTNINMVYPCIIYEYDREETTYASNAPYISRGVYTLTYITRASDQNIFDSLKKAFRFISLDRTFKTNNLYHFTFRLIY